MFYCQYQKSSSSLVALLARGSKGGGGDGHGGGKQQNLGDKLLISEHFIEEPAFNAKCVGVNGVAPLFATFWDIGINTTTPNNEIDSV